MIDKISSQHMSLTPRTTSKIENNDYIKNEASINEQSFRQNSKPKKEEQLKEVVDSMNKFIQASHTSLKFVLHDELNEYYVTVVDDITQEVVKEIPSKKLLDVYAAMTDFLGLMVDKKI